MDHWRPAIVGRAAQGRGIDQLILGGTVCLLGISVHSGTKTSPSAKQQLGPQSHRCVHPKSYREREAQTDGRGRPPQPDPAGQSDGECICSTNS